MTFINHDDPHIHQAPLTKPSSSVADVAIAGGKNASLGELDSALGPQGIGVPDGFAITAELEVKQLPMKEKTTPATTRSVLKQRALERWENEGTRFPTSRLSSPEQFPQWTFALLWFNFSSCVGMLGVCFFAAKANTNGHHERHPE